MNLVVFLVIGLIAGLLFRALDPEDELLGLVGSLVLGALGGFGGGALGSMLGTGGELLTFAPSGLLGSTLGALVALALGHSAGRRRGT